MMPRFSDYPKVEVEGSTIVITYENGDRMTWGEEASEFEAIRVATEMDLELKAIEYIQRHIVRFITEMKKVLARNNIPEEHLVEILVEGHWSAIKEMGFSEFDYIRERGHSRLNLD